jgi:DNA-binding Xre family transcriptional regulator
MLALREGDDETAQLAALNELCELLAVSSEDALSMFPVDTLVPVLVGSLAACNSRL